MTDTPRTRQQGTSKNALPDYIKINADGSATVTLVYPREVAGVKTGSVTVRRPKVRDRLEATKSSTDIGEQEIMLFSKLAELSPDEIEDLDMEDYGRIQEAVTGFTSSRRSPR